MTGPRIAARHPQNPTARWAKFQADVRRAALRSVDYRDRQDRERHDDTQYARAADQPKGATP